jgi:hypothetical protein
VERPVKKLLQLAKYMNSLWELVMEMARKGYMGRQFWFEEISWILVPMMPILKSSI